MIKCDCGHVIRGKTVGDVMKKGGVHMKKVHPEMKMTKQMAEAIKKKIKNV